MSDKIPHVQNIATHMLHWIFQDLHCMRGPTNVCEGATLSQLVHFALLTALTGHQTESAILDSIEVCP